MNAVFDELGVPISVKEVVDVINGLKCRKSPGKDNLINEYFKHMCDDLSPLLTRMFNVIFDTGIFPHTWCEGVIVPIFKKGDPDDTDNYRGITLMSCMLKTYTTILNNRLMKWSEDNSVLTDAQFGFRQGVGTVDAIFSLQSIIEKHLSNNKKLYCCFVDYRKAFDSVNRNFLFKKLIKLGVRGKMFQSILSLYKNVKSCVKYKNNFSEFFNVEQGVLQGEALSPLLFLYI